MLRYSKPNEKLHKEREREKEKKDEIYE